MRRSVLFFALALLCFMTTGAEAVNWKVVQLQSTPSRDQLLATCRREGGHYAEGPGSYSCSKQCTSNQGCSVECKDGSGCKGRTPARVFPTGGVTDLGGILNAGTAGRAVTR
jgi:hypothetical protein